MTGEPEADSALDAAARRLERARGYAGGAAVGAAGASRGRAATCSTSDRAKLAAELDAARARERELEEAGRRGLRRPRPRHRREVRARRLAGGRPEPWPTVTRRGERQALRRRLRGRPGKPRPRRWPSSSTTRCARSAPQVGQLGETRLFLMARPAAGRRARRRCKARLAAGRGRSSPRRQAGSRGVETARRREAPGQPPPARIETLAERRRIAPASPLESRARRAPTLVPAGLAAALVEGNISRGP